MKRLIIIGAAALILSGCFDREQTAGGLARAVSAVGAIEAANNSPDVTVKSWWRVKDASANIRIEVCKSNLKVAAPYFGKLSQLAEGRLITEGECEKTPLVFDRQITKVEVQSDTRAVVTAHIKNATPPEDGAVLDAEAKKSKEDGEPFQYVLERQDTKSGWKITKISSFSSYTKDWRDAYPKDEPSNNRYVYGSFQ
ncbi:hypothetical protein [Pseudomonas rhodesiae]|uniref:hypothetical protein n=1 Tax=Pseudomonas rhodesiae TaxID=76760 RepID=UPI00241CE4F6|nr:hypothetical protein [Pseudomonas rhodesiae]